MGPEARDRVTAIVAGWSEQETPGRAALDEVVPDLYRELRRMAQWRLGGRDQTLQATALVHEAYLKLVDQSQVGWQGRTHFMAVAAKVMRNVLIDHARERGAQKRGGDWQRVTLAPGGEPALPEMDLDQMLGLHIALERPGRARRAAGAGRGAPLLRGSQRGGGGGRARCLQAYGRGLLDPRPGLAAP
jgi:RNA polymerase sigma factor (TIGR02999 family)